MPPTRQDLLVKMERFGMEDRGKELLSQLKMHILSVMQQHEDCRPGQPGAPYRVIEDSAGLGLALPAQDGWLTWSVLAALVQDGQVEVVKRGRRLFWRLMSS